MKAGLILGKFMPPHKGHKYLIDFAQNRVDRVIIVLGTTPTDTIPGALRLVWMKDLYPKALVVEIPDNNPSGVTPVDPEYWTIWRDNLIDHLPFIPKTLFSSEDYGIKIAKALGIRHKMVDLKRATVPVSASMIRENPAGAWEYIQKPVREYYKEQMKNG